MAANNEELERLFKNLPRQVYGIIILATLLGLLLCFHGIFIAISNQTFSNKTIFYGGLIFGNFLFSAVSLIKKSRIGYILIVIFALLPTLGSFAGAIHLLALVVGGRINLNVSETIASILAVFQLIVIIALFYFLLSSVGRSYIWKSPNTKLQIQ